MVRQKNSQFTHFLFKKDVYPSHHIYLSSNSINIHSKVEIKDGDIVVTGNRSSIKVFTTSDFDGSPRKSTYYKNCDYYEFKYEKINK